MISLRCQPLLRQIPACLRRLSVTASLDNPVLVRMPALSPTMSDGGIVSWLKNEGEEISAGDGLCEIQTDKAVVTMEIEEDGVLAKILKPENTMGIKVGDMIAVIAEEGEDWRSISAPEEETYSSSTDVVADRTNDSLTPARSSPDVEYPPLRDVTGSGIGPAVRLLLELYHLRAIDVTPTGPHGRLLKGDVLAHIAQRQLRPQPPSDSPPPPIPAIVSDSVVKAPPPKTALPPLPPKPVSPPPSVPTPPALTDLAHTDLPLSANHAHQAQLASLGKRAVPHTYIRAEVNLNHILPRIGAEIGIAEFVIKALANAIQVLPEANSFLSEDGSIALRNSFDVAVTTSSSMTPRVVRNVSAMTSSDISNIIRQHPENTEANPEAENVAFKVVDLSDTNVEHVAAIVTPPQAGVLTIGGVQKMLSPGEVEGQMELTSQVTVTLSVDRRILDESKGAELLSALKASLENVIPIPAMPSSSKPAAESFDNDLLGIGLD